MFLDTGLILIFLSFALFCGFVATLINFKNSTSVIHNSSHIGITIYSLSLCFSVNFYIVVVLACLVMSYLYRFFENSKVSENEIISIINIIVLLVGFFLEIFYNHGKNLALYFTGDVNFVTIDLAACLFATSSIFATFCIVNIDKIIRDIVYRNNQTSFLMLFFEYFLLVLLIKIFGILVCGVYFVTLPMISKKYCKNPVSVMIFSGCFALGMIIFSYLLAFYFDLYFSIVSCIFCVIAFVLSICLTKLRKFIK